MGTSRHVIKAQHRIGFPGYAIAAFAVCLTFLSVSPAIADVNGPGPSDPSLFDTVINLPPDPDLGSRGSIGGVAGQTTQLNVSDGGTVGVYFDADSGSEVNISGGVLGLYFDANAGSEVNISG